MTETKTTNDSTQHGPRVTVVRVPNEHAERVIAFARGLQQQDAEVTGYSFPGTVSVGGASPIGPGPIGGIAAHTGTSCVVTGLREDYSCADTDAAPMS
jgi:hypothetical protein